MRPIITGRRSLCTASVVVLSALIAAPAAAQTSSGVQIDEVVVQARRTAENIQEVPIAVTALSAEQMREKPIVTAQDLQYATPGMVANSSSRSNDNVRFTIRGQSTADIILTTDSSIGVYVDGVYIARAWGLRAGLYDLDHVEILKGPQGTLYGKNTTGGAISLFTAKPRLDETSGFLTLSAGSFSTGSIQGAANIPLVDGKLAARVSVNLISTDGYGHTAVGRLTDYQSAGLRGQLLYKPTENLTLRAYASYAGFDGTGPLVRVVQLAPAGSAFLDAGIQLAGFSSLPAALAAGRTPAGLSAAGLAYIQARTNTNGFYDTSSTRDPASKYEGWETYLAADWALTDAVTVKSLTAYREFQRGQRNDLDNSDLTLFHTSTSTHATFFSQEFQLDGRVFADRLKYIAGAYYSREAGKEDSSNTILPSLTGGALTVFEGALVNKSLGVFGQGVYQLTDQLSATVGLRWSQDKRDFQGSNRTVLPTSVICQVPDALIKTPGRCFADLGTLKSDAVSYNFSLAYQPTDQINLYATTRKGYRAGGWNITTTKALGFPPFRPETVKDYEVGVKTELFDRKVRLNVAAYQSDYKNIQKTTLVIFPGPPVTQGTTINNAATATIRGVEADLLARPMAGLSLDATLAYTDAKYDRFLIRNPAGAVVQDRTAEPFELPKWTYSLGAKKTWSLPFGDISARADWFWRDSVIFTAASALLPTESILRQKAYGLLGGRLEWSKPDKGFSFALVGRNILDKKYYSAGLDARAVGFGLLQPGEPRYVGVELRQVFGRN